MSDVRYTVLQIVNEVQRKLGLDSTGTLSANKLAIELVDFVNDICNDLSDFGNWQEMIVSANVTAAEGVRDYSIITSAAVKNIGDIYFSQNSGPLNNITIQEMRLMTRVSSSGTPSQFCIFGTDSNYNPLIRVSPTPSSTADGGIFSIIYYVKAPQYTTSDNNEIVPFPGDLVVDGVLALAILNESGGAPTDRYTKIFQDYTDGKKEALNRFNGDTGWQIQFSPSFGRRR